MKARKPLDPVETYIDPATGVEVKVYQSEKAPSDKTRRTRSYKSQKQRREERQHKGQQVKMSLANSYDAAVTYDVEEPEYRDAEELFKALRDIPTGEES